MMKVNLSGEECLSEHGSEYFQEQEDSEECDDSENNEESKKLAKGRSKCNKDAPRGKDDASKKLQVKDMDISGPISDRGQKGDAQKTEPKEKYKHILKKFDLNYDLCNFCGADAKTELLCCSTCPRSFHQRCVSLARIPKGIWNCPVCAKREKYCTICEKSLYLSSDSKSIRCFQCRCMMHFDCVEVPVKLLLKTPAYWLEKEDSILKQKPLVLDHICYDCQKALGVERILDYYNYEERRENPIFSNNYYLVKFKTLSYRHVAWVRGIELKTYTHPTMVSRFEQKIRDAEIDGVSEILDICRIREDFLKVEKVIDKWVPNPEEYEISAIRYLVKWRSLEYQDCTWEREMDLEGEKDLIKKYEKINESALVGSGFPAKPSAKYKKLEKQPEFVKEGSILKHQLDGINWILFMWFQQKNAILTDEIKLSKAIEGMVFLRYLYIELGIMGPFLVCVPSSAIDTWSRECGLWYPEANTTVYSGTQASKQIIRKKDFLLNKDQKEKVKGPTKELSCKVNVLLISHESLWQDRCFFKKIYWKAIIVNDANASILQVFHEFKAGFRLLLAGASQQNVFAELLALPLLQFIFPDKFTNEQQEKILIEAQADETKRQSIIYELQPNMMKRTALDAMLYIPKVKQFVVSVELTQLQKELYKCVLTRNSHALRQLDRKAKGNEQISLKSLTNVLMLLRLCANHGLLLTRKYNSPLAAEEWFDIKSDEANILPSIVAYSGKMQFLDTILIHLLKEGNHKILICSKHRLMLDIIEDYLKFKRDILRAKWLRLDGGIQSSQRQQLIDKFNDEKGECFVFLLSTSSGGLGINLTAIDTVIVYDSDFDCSDDVLAQYIGRNTMAVIYHLISKDTVEEKIAELSKNQLEIKQFFAKRDKTSSSIIDRILRFGTERLFAEAPDNIVFSEENIKRLLDRSVPSGEDLIKIGKKDGDDYLSKFGAISVPAEVLPGAILSTRAVILDDRDLSPDYWTILFMGQHEKKRELQRKRKLDKIGCGKLVQNSDNEESKGYNKKKCLSPTESVVSCETLWRAADKDIWTSENETVEQHIKQVSSIAEHLISSDLCVLPIDVKEGKLICKDKEVLDAYQIKLTEPVSARTSISIVLWGFHELNRRDFMEALMKFGIFENNWKALYDCCASDKENSLRLRTYEEFLYYAQRFASILREMIQTQKYGVKLFFTGPYTIKDIILRIYRLSTLRVMCKKYSESPSTFAIQTDDYKTFIQGKWKATDDYKLIKGNVVHGFGCWEKILFDKELWLGRLEAKRVEDKKEAQAGVWQALFDKISDVSYQDTIKKTSDENLPHIAQSYVQKYASTRLKFLITEMEKKFVKQ